MCCYYWRCDGKDAALQAQGDIAFLCVGSEEAAVSLPIWLYTVGQSCSLGRRTSEALSHVL